MIAVSTLFVSLMVEMGEDTGFGSWYVERGKRSYERAIPDLRYPIEER